VGVVKVDSWLASLGLDKGFALGFLRYPSLVGVDRIRAGLLSSLLLTFMFS
jgi:hypothetical protein